MKRITATDNERLLRPFTVEEVKDALFSMAPDKSPGPDGFSPAFFQHFWNEIGGDVSHFILECLNGHAWPIGMNDAYVTLIPKKAMPTYTGDLRPIALCNVTYKILSKVLANRLKEVLDGAISAPQSAFLPGRLITDNVLIASEVVHYLHRKRQGSTGWCALKLDMAKAYDKMEWGFLEQILLRMGFDGRWIDIILRCVTTVRYKVSLNGCLTNHILPTRGLRQGDPLSPYLFILCAEGLGYLLSKAVLSRRISPCVVARGAPGISHLFFADDSLLFFKATTAEAMVVKDCLNTYEAMSGQSVNFNKSCILFSPNTTADLKNAVTTVLNVDTVNNLGKYLGLPMGIGRNRKEVFSYIEAKLRHRLAGWHKNVLSRAGKEILIKSVAQALPTYTMSIYYLPLTFCEHLERIMNQFWWCNKGSGIRWMAWQRICSPKAVGGLGFKHLNRFNLALLAKQGWRLLTNPTSLTARIFKSRYYPNEEFLDAKIGANPSYVWRSILAGKDILTTGCVKRIGNGESTQVWKHPWLPDAVDPFVHSPCTTLDCTMTVSELVDPVTKDWDLAKLNQLFDARDVGLITSIPVALDFNDSWCWREDSRGQYSVKNGYKLLATLHNDGQHINFAWKKLWNLKIPPNVCNFLWRCLHGVLPTMVAICSRRVDVDTCCHLCKQHSETVRHLFFDCIHVQAIWNPTYRQLIAEDDDFPACLSKWLAAANESIVKWCVAACWAVWKHRNALVWSNKPWNPTSVIMDISNMVMEWEDMDLHDVRVRTTTANASPMDVAPGTMMIYVDAAVFVDLREAYVGVYMTNSAGDYVAAKNGSIRCLNDVLLVEAMAVKEALSWAKERGDNNVIIYSDCQMVCKWFDSVARDLSYAGCILEECRTLKRLFESVSIRFIPRSANKFAHTLARATRSQPGPMCWLSVIPSCIGHLF
ncbi:PREDICTED: uncharacterized protein LOC109164834 [Ipomoea nil]|uniref:uncharacterized protein LOC109164834 n=1 Tax=Ipomoea nil TaxID=35883 RepID=UPI000901A1AB|nr:PREDICTED: uncharacterized protein LOC109164834 [Ipomoea nil]